MPPIPIVASTCVSESMYACMHDVSDAIVANQLAILARENGREYYRAIFSCEYIGPVLYFRFMDDVIFVLYLQI